MTGERKTYLLGGRRVAVRDLLDAGLLSAGQVLTWERPKVGRTHKASVDARGSLLVDGRSFATPSAAACTAAGVRQMDGWSAWTTDDGNSLHALRARLLDRIADEARAAERIDSVRHEEPADIESGSESDGEPDVESPRSLLPRHDFLREARRGAEGGEPLTLTVRRLLAHWGGNAREHRITRSIEADLGNYGLVTRPNFLQVSLDDDITLVVLESEPEPEAVPAQVPVGPSSSIRLATPAPPTELVELPDIGLSLGKEIGLTLGNLTSAARKLVSVKPTSTLTEALTLMLLNDFSQLPILSNKYKCEWAVTWKSITRARLRDPDAALSEATVRVQSQPYSHDLHSLLPVLQADEFVIVTDSHNVISGIVTIADVIAAYGERTLPFLLIGELDQELRQIMFEIDLDKIQAACESSDQSNLESRDDMTLYHYERVLGNPECWATLRWPLDRKAFVQRLGELRRIRNDVMHFNPDGVPDGTVEQLRHMLSLIREFASTGPS